MHIDDLYKLRKKDIVSAASGTARAFKQDPLFNYIMEDRQESKYYQRLMKFELKYSVLYRNCFASSHELEGVICFSPYKDYGYGLFKSIRAGVLSIWTLGSRAGERFKEYDEFAKNKHEQIIQEPHIYIELLAVDPKYQGSGYGGKLLSAVLDVSDQQGYPCYLETHLESNASFYENFGFETVERVVVPNTEITQYCMLYR